jgi:hypothetical protein
MKKYFFYFLATYLFILPALGCYTRVDKPKTSQARLNLPNWGIVIDATYDKKLDNIVPGYKIVTIALTNRSVDIIKLDPVHDQWMIEDAWGRKQRAIVSLRIRDPQIWGTLPGRVKDLVEYPAGVQMGYTQTFDLFFPENTELGGFRAISFYAATLKRNFDALSSSSLDRAVPAADNTDSSQIVIPSSGSKQKVKTSKKYP